MISKKNLFSESNTKKRMMRPYIAVLLSSLLLNDLAIVAAKTRVDSVIRGVETTKTISYDNNNNDGILLDLDSSFRHPYRMFGSDERLPAFVDPLQLFVGQVRKRILSTISVNGNGNYYPMIRKPFQQVDRQMRLLQRRLLPKQLPHSLSIIREQQLKAATRLITNFKETWMIKPATKRSLQKSFVNYPLRIVGQVLSRRTFSVIPAPIDPATADSSNSFTTEISELANYFEQAFIVEGDDNEANEMKQDIHVGKLLLASEQLASTMRRIGLSQSANDMAGNIGKIRKVYDRLPETCRDSMPAILQHELSTFKDRNHKIPDQSAACGFLWLGRSLQYQNDLFRHMLKHEDCTFYEAANEAYEQDLKQHLSWPLQKLCQTVMAATLTKKCRKQMFAEIGGFPEDTYGQAQDEATKEDLQNTMDCLQPMLCRWQQVLDELELGML